MTTNVTFVVIFCFFYETKVEDNNECASSLSFFFFSYIAEDNDEPPHSSSSSAIQEKKNTKTQKRMISLPTCHHPLQLKKKNLDVGFSWVVGDDDEPLTCHRFLAFFPHL